MSMTQMDNVESQDATVAMASSNADEKDEQEELVNIAKVINAELAKNNWEEAAFLLSGVEKTLPVLPFSAQQTALHIAVEFDAAPEIVEHLLRVHDAQEANKSDKFGNTPLHLSCRYGQFTETLSLLVKAWPQAVLMENSSRRTPIDDLFMREEEDQDEDWDFSECVNTILDACPDAIHHVDRHGQTILHSIFKNATMPELIETIPALLLERKSELALIVDKQNVTALHEACKRTDSIEIVQHLMETCPREFQMSRDAEGRTILHCAIYWHSSAEIVRELVTQCYDFVHSEDNEGKTPMDYLVSFYAPEFSNKCVTVGWTNFLDNVVEMVHAFFVAGPHMSGDGDLVLHAALYTERCPLPILEFLTVSEPELATEVDALGNLPLHLAAKIQVLEDDDPINYIEIIQELLLRHPEGARIPDQRGHLPLKVMIDANQKWSCGLQTLLAAHPAAICDLDLNAHALCALLAKLAKLDTPDVMYRLLREAPHLAEY